TRRWTSSPPWSRPTSTSRRPTRTSSIRRSPRASPTPRPTLPAPGPDGRRRCPAPTPRRPRPCSTRSTPRTSSEERRVGKRDWSSDVCSSDLDEALDQFAALVAAHVDLEETDADVVDPALAASVADAPADAPGAWAGREAPLPGADTPEAEALLDALDAAH